MTRARHAAVVATRLIPRGAGGGRRCDDDGGGRPVYAAAAGESSLRQVLRTAAPDQSGLHVQINGGITVDPFSEVTRTLPSASHRPITGQPTAELDHDAQEVVIRRLREAAEGGASVVIATHDPQIAERCDRELRLHDGRLSELY